MRSCSFIFALLLGCAASAQIQVVATTAMVADLASRVGGEHAQVTALMGPGTDPHLYRPTPSDLAKLRRAEVILHNGLDLEGRMGRTFEKMSRDRIVVAVARSIPAERLLREEGRVALDPHLWFDVALWAETLPSVADALAQARPELRETFTARAAQAHTELLALDAWVRETLAAIPPERRILITSHDAFRYFGRAYGFEVVALQGISTAGEAGLADLTRLVEFVKARKIPAVFVESSVPQATLRRVSGDSGARLGGELFSDAAGSARESIDGHPLSTYEGMIRHNVRTIVAALAP